MIAIAADIQVLVQQLQRALREAHGFEPVKTGTLTLCMHEEVLQSVKTETYLRVTREKVVDRRAERRG